jgi:hypothetical protein
MVKFFLQEVYLKWRAFEGLPIRAPYHEEKLGLFHTGPGTVPPDPILEEALRAEDLRRRLRNEK